MNSDDQFEERLRRQTLRDVPAGWREEILSAAGCASGSSHASRVTHHSILSALRSQLSILLWPHPKAWAGLAVAWLVIIGVNFAMREPSAKDYALQTAPPSPQMRELLRQQGQLFAELVGPIEKPEADRPKPPAARPRSQCREEFLNA